MSLSEAPLEDVYRVLYDQIFMKTGDTRTTNPGGEVTLVDKWVSFDAATLAPPVNVVAAMLASKTPFDKKAGTGDGGGRGGSQHRGESLPSPPVSIHSNKGCIRSVARLVKKKHG